VEDHALNAFLEAFNELTGLDYAIAARPDQLNRSTPDIDAFAEADGQKPLAVELTRLESFRGQYSAARVFVDHIVPLEKELDGVFDYHFQLVVPHEALQPGTDWAAMAVKLKTWFLEHGGTAQVGQTAFTLPGIPFTFKMGKWPSELHKVYAYRTLPPGEFTDLLLDRMRDCLDHKYEELGDYQKAGATTVLLLHSEDITSINEGIVGAAASDVLEDEPHPYLDQVWFVRVLGDETLVYCLMGPDEVRLASEERARRQLLDQ
jgi:hypothetical protein